MCRARLAKRALVEILRRGEAAPQDDIVSGRRGTHDRRHGHARKAGEKPPAFRKRPLQLRDTVGSLYYRATKPLRGLQLHRCGNVHYGNGGRLSVAEIFWVFVGVA